MARTAKDSIVRRTEILDAAQRLVYTKGYEQMTIQDILDTLQISKGAFYHYFDSKNALLEALIDRTIEEGLQVIQPVIQDDSLPALEKFHRTVAVAANWKQAKKAFLLALFRTWYDDNNALMRQKQLNASARQLTPLLAQITYQGIREGIFSTPYPDQAGAIIMALLIGMGDALAYLLLASNPYSDQIGQARNTVGAYTVAMERSLGLPENTLHIVEETMLEEWFTPSPSQAPA